MTSNPGSYQSRNISQQRLSIGLDLGDRNRWYCMVDKVGKVQLEQRVSGGLVGPAGIEPATLGLEIRCSIRLSYGPLEARKSCAQYRIGAEVLPDGIRVKRRAWPRLYWRKLQPTSGS